MRAAVPAILDVVHRPSTGRAAGAGVLHGKVDSLTTFRQVFRKEIVCRILYPFFPEALQIVSYRRQKLDLSNRCSTDRGEAGSPLAFVANRKEPDRNAIPPHPFEAW